MGTDCVQAGVNDLISAIRPRTLDSDKYANGRVLVIGGSADFHGAPALSYSAAYAMLAAMRSGAGYVSAFVPRSALAANRAVSPCVIVRPFKLKNLSKSDTGPIIKHADRSDSIIIGPGLGRSANSAAAAKLIVMHCIKRLKVVVVDADAIRAASKLKGNGHIIFTPNRSEFEREWGPVPNRKADICKKVEETARKTGACILLKGHETVVSNGYSTKIIRSKSAALATMGTGDVLSGIIGGLAAINNDAFVSAVAGAYVHAKIGDMLHAKIGDCLTPMDLVKNVHVALNMYNYSMHKFKKKGV